MMMFRARLLALLAEHAPVESMAHFRFECPVTISARARMYDVIIKASVNGKK
jgi:hypothetical protein